LTTLENNAAVKVTTGPITGSHKVYHQTESGLRVPARRIIDTLVVEGRVRRAYLGVVGVPAPLPDDVAERTGQRAGLRVHEVVSGGPADRAGLRAGDLVLTVGRTRVSDAQGIQRQLFAEVIGTALPITALRNGAMVDVYATPAELVG